MADDLGIDRLRECLSYDPRTGILRWKIQRSNVAVGAIAGCADHRGYRLVRLDRRLLLAHTAEEAAAAFEREHQAIHGTFSWCEAR